MKISNIVLLVATTVAVTIGAAYGYKLLTGGATSTGAIVSSETEKTADGEISPYLSCFKVAQIVEKVGEGKVEFKGIPVPRHVCYSGNAILKP